MNEFKLKLTSVNQATIKLIYQFFTSESKAKHVTYVIDEFVVSRFCTVRLLLVCEQCVHTECVLCRYIPGVPTRG